MSVSGHGDLGRFRPVLGLTGVFGAPYTSRALLWFPIKSHSCDHRIRCGEIGSPKTLIFVLGRVPHISLIRRISVH